MVVVPLMVVLGVQPVYGVTGVRSPYTVRRWSRKRFNRRDLFPRHDNHFRSSNLPMIAATEIIIRDAV